MFGRLLAMAREARNVSQAELGRLLGGATQSTVSAWELGKNEPEPSAVFALEDVLELPGGYLSRHLGYLPADKERLSRPLRTPEGIASDPNLDDYERRLLLAVYRQMKWARECDDFGCHDDP